MFVAQAREMGSQRPGGKHLHQGCVVVVDYFSDLNKRSFMVFIGRIHGLKCSLLANSQEKCNVKLGSHNEIEASHGLAAIALVWLQVLKCK